MTARTRGSHSSPSSHPALPVGANYSHGLERAVEAGDVQDETSLEAWLRNLPSTARDPAALALVNDLTPSAEFRLETAQQGRSFLDAVLASWPQPHFTEFTASLREIAYPVALGLAAACHCTPLRDTAGSYLTALAGNLVSAAIRLASLASIRRNEWYRNAVTRLSPCLTSRLKFQNSEFKNRKTEPRFLEENKATT